MHPKFVFFKIFPEIFEKTLFLHIFSQINFSLSNFNPRTHLYCEEKRGENLHVSTTLEGYKIPPPPNL